jgi:hypothetical protein
LNFNWKLMAKIQDILAFIDGPKSCFTHNLAGRIVGSIPKPYDPLDTIFNAVKMIKAGGGGVSYTLNTEQAGFPRCP